MIRYRLFAAVLLVTLAACASGPQLKGADRLEAARVNTNLGVDYLRKGMLDEAIDKLEKAVEQDPQSAVAHSALAVAYTQAGSLDKANRQYRRAIKVDPDNPETRNNFGTLLCRLGETDEAEKFLLEAARHPRYKTPEAAWTNAGICVVKTKPQRAEGYFRQALERNRQFPDALSQMAVLSLQQKDYWRARAFLQRYDEVASATAETLWVGLQVERGLGNNNAAIHYEQRLKTEFPESEQAASLTSSSAIKTEPPKKAR